MLAVSGSHFLAPSWVQWRPRHDFFPPFPLVEWWSATEAAAVQCWSNFEEIPHVQGKRNPSKTVSVARGHQRADTLKPQSQKTSQSDHTDHSFSHSVKLSHAVWGHPRWAGHGGEV